MLYSKTLTPPFKAQEQQQEEEEAQRALTAAATDAAAAVRGPKLNCSDKDRAMDGSLIISSSQRLLWLRFAAAAVVLSGRRRRRTRGESDTEITGRHRTHSHACMCSRTARIQKGYEAQKSRKQMHCTNFDINSFFKTQS